MTAIFKEVLADVTERKDASTIVAIGSVVLGIIFVTVGATTVNLFNFLLLMNMAVIGWTLHVGWLEKKRGEKPKLLILALVALFLYVLQAWHFSEALASLSQFKGQIETMQDFMK